MNPSSSIVQYFRREELKSSLKKLATSVGGQHSVTVVGGAVRELVLSQLCSVPARIPDIDVAVLVDFDPKEVSRSLGEHNCACNSFGGIKWQSEFGMQLDIWSVKSWAAKIGKPVKSSYTLSEIKKFLDFNLNAGFYALDADYVDVDLICNAVESRCFELHNSLVPPDYVQVARILKLDQRVRQLGFQLGPRISEYLRHVVQSATKNQLTRSKEYFERKCSYLGDRLYFDARIQEVRQNGMVPPAHPDANPKSRALTASVAFRSRVH